MKQLTFIVLLFSMALVSCSKPIAQFKTPQATWTAPADVTFENQSENAERYEWDFGDGQTSTQKQPSHHYTTSGQYHVILKAYKGTKAKTTKQLVVVKPPAECLIEVGTPYGNMLFELADDTPIHRDNISKLAVEGFYTGILFHRIINGFMIQGGDPSTKKSHKKSDIGYTIPSEITPSLVHIRGALAAARMGDSVNPEKRSSGSQFYIVQGRKVTDAILNRVESMRGFTYTPEQRKEYLAKGGTPQLDMAYTVFGKIIKGDEVIDKLAAVKTKSGDRPVEDIWMKITLIN